MEVEAKNESAPMVSIERPWYMKTEEIYEVVKNAAVDVKVGDVVLADRALTVVDDLASRVSKKVYPDAAEMSVVAKMDELTTAVLKGVDVHVDVLQTKCTESVESLHTVVLTKAETGQAAYDETKGKVISAIDSTKDNVAAAYVKVDGQVKELVTRVSTVSPASVVTEVYEPCVAKVTSVYNSATPLVVDTATSMYNKAVPVVATVLDNAQPYVHKAVDVSTPYVERALEVSKPIVAVAVDVSQPVYEKVVIVAEPYISSERGQQLLASTHFAVAAVKKYCNSTSVTASESCECPSSSSVSTNNESVDEVEVTVLDLDLNTIDSDDDAATGSTGHAGEEHQEEVSPQDLTKDDVFPSSPTPGSSGFHPKCNYDVESPVTESEK